MDVFVDDNGCQGHARCSMICPEVFDQDDVGFAVVASPHVPSAGCTTCRRTLYSDQDRLAVAATEAGDWFQRHLRP